MRWLRLVVGALVHLVRRFVAHSPLNVYEDIVFSALRAMAEQLGKQERTIRA